MGSCCDGNHKDYDVINIKIDKDKNTKKPSYVDFQNQTDYNIGENDFQQSNFSQTNNSPLKPYISKKKLKLIITQSKSIEEGKEYILNSLGLIDSNNNYKDGVTIFGDANVSKLNNI